MTIRLVDPLEHLVEGVRSNFTARGVTSVVTAGFKERRRQDTQGPGLANRVVFLPGDPSGKGGTLSFGVRDGGTREIKGSDGKLVATWRSLGEWTRTITVAVWAYDGTKPTDELAQIVACTALAIEVRRAVDAVGLADLEWGDAQWTLPKTNTLGQEVLIGLQLRMPMPDVLQDVGFPGFTLAKSQG